MDGLWTPADAAEAAAGAVLVSAWPLEARTTCKSGATWVTPASATPAEGNTCCLCGGWWVPWWTGCARPQVPFGP